MTGDKILLDHVEKQGGGAIEGKAGSELPGDEYGDQDHNQGHKELNDLGHLHHRIFDFSAPAALGK